MDKETKQTWKETDLNVDSLWIIDERDKSGKHSNVYHGNFIPQIPNQLIRRYTDENETVLELFSGSGTTLFECEKLKRNYLGFDINKQINSYVENKMQGVDSINFVLNNCDVTDDACFTEAMLSSLKKENIKMVDFMIAHPPYLDIIKFTQDKKDLFLKIAGPDNLGVSRWVNVNEFIGEFSDLQLGNGGSWCRSSSSLSRTYIVEFDKSLTSGNSIDAIRLNGFNNEASFNQTIRKDIRDYYTGKKCVMLGVKGFSENTIIEVDHKDGRKYDWRVSNPLTQNYDDFQPLCKAANDVKRQICKECKKTNHRWNAQNIEGNPYPFYDGTEEYSDNLGCVGCYQYDPVEYRKRCIKRVTEEASKHTVDFIMKKLYPGKTEMTTHVFIVDETTFKLHLEYLFAGKVG